MNVVRSRHRRLLVTPGRRVRPTGSVGDRIPVFLDVRRPGLVRRAVTVVDYRTSSEATHALRATYRFLDPAITGFLLDGFDDRAAIELLR